MQIAQRGGVAAPLSATLKDAFGVIDSDALAVDGDGRLHHIPHLGDRVIPLRRFSWAFPKRCGDHQRSEFRAIAGFINRDQEHT